MVHHFKQKFFARLSPNSDKEFKIKQEFLYGTACICRRVHRAIGKLSPHIFLHRGAQNEQPAG